MQDLALRRDQIIDYFEHSEVDYRWVLNLERDLALHFGHWDEGTRTLSEALARENEVLAELAQIDTTSLVLDAGCGVGGSAIFLAKKYGCHVTGINLSRRQLDAALQNSRKSQVEHLTEFLEMDFLNTRFPEATFDVVWALESLCHAVDKRSFFLEAYRLLKPGGRLIIADGFYKQASFTAPEKSSMDKWLRGWGVSSLDSSENFHRYSEEIGFKEVSFLETTRHILPSSKILYHWSLLGLVFGKVMQWLGLRNEIQASNVLAAYFQYKTLSRNLWKYGFFLAKKL